VPAAEAPPPAETAPAPGGGDPSTRLVLLVDDDEDFRSLLEASIKKEGFRVIAAENGRDAATKLEPDAPDLVITDLMMPGEGGYEFMRALQSAGHGGVPVILVTGAVLDPSTIAAMRQDANIIHTFAKPVKIAALMSAIHVKLGTSRPKAADAGAESF
ncbi:MAG: response regulator, partial [Elusimicrobia bacterium]|nr:response regulator [Elusimicrobiota bacterium]